MPFDDQILLLPRDRYWDWLQACSRYILTFGPNATPDPGVAARYMAPRQVVSFPHFEGAFPEIGDPLAWFRREAAGVRLDPVDAGSPEAMTKAMKRRVKQNDRYGARQRAFHLVWPTDYAVVTQPFGINPQIYRRYGMPGHEGVDFRALTNTNVYAGADGEVYEVHANPKDHAYGIHIRIQHADGYKTVYAHLARALVRKGEPVQAGQLIGRADSTGNSSAAHLHLSLKRDGATARQETNFPKDIIDPTPFLVWPAGFPSKGSKGLSRAAPRIGLNLTRPGGVEKADIDRAARLRAGWVSISLTEGAGTVQALRSALPGVRLIVRVAESPPEDVLHASRFAARVAADVGRHYRLGIRDFELTAFPNEHRGGFGRLWRSGTEFAAWLAGVMRRLREIFPEARFGYPCLAPGGDVIGRQQSAAAFFDQSSTVVGEADWIAVACELDGGHGILERVVSDFPEKPVLVTEAGESNPSEGPEAHAIRLAAFVKGLPHPPVTAVLVRPDAEASDGAPDRRLSWEAVEILAEAVET
jgi:hypothetical protein